MKRIPTLLMIALAAALLLPSTHALMAQLPALQADPDLVDLRITAIERSGNRPVRGLRKEHFKVFEDNTPQDIVHFSDEDLPLHMAILLDANGATKDEITRAMSGMTSTVTRDDEFILLDSGKAPLNDAILQALKELEVRGNHGNRALLLVTSKRDPGAYPLTKVRERLRELDIKLYVTALQTGSEISGDSDRQALKELTERTGGSAFFPSSISLHPDIFKTIVRQLRNQYQIAYRSTNRATDGKWRKIKITAEFLDTKTGKTRKMDILTKTGYYAPKVAK